MLEPDILGGPAVRLVVVGRPAVARIRPNVPYVVVSVTDPGTPAARIAANPLRMAVLRLSFASSSPEGPQASPATARDAADIVAFVAAYRHAADLIVCQSEAGVFRAAGIAAALSRWLNGHDEEFFRRYVPDRLVYQLVLKAIQEQGPRLGSGEPTRV